MGRYYSGDIEGKFWFGLQSSNDADFFGVIGRDPNYLEYAFEETHLPSIRKGINECREKLGRYESEIKSFLASTNGYTDKQIEERLNLPKENTRTMLEWYARLQLGEKILAHVEKHRTCYFQAEL